MPNYPQPPVEMVMPDPGQLIVTILCGAACLAFFLAAIRSYRRTGSPLAILGLLGGLFASLNEPGGNILYLCWHAGIGSYEVFTFFDRPIPLWAVFAYPCYFGAMALGVDLLLQRGVTYKSMWKAAGILFVFMCIFESALQEVGLFKYYGYQPYKIMHYPAGMGLMNVVAVFASALMFRLMVPYLKGLNWLWIVIIPAWTQLAALAPMLPAQWVLNTNYSPEIKYLGVSVALLTCLAIIESMARFAALKFPRPQSDAARVGGSVISGAR